MSPNPTTQSIIQAIQDKDLVMEQQAKDLVAWERAARHLFMLASRSPNDADREAARIFEGMMTP